MIDVHCHLEQKDYDKDRDEVIKRAKEKGLKAIITCCAHPEDFEKTIEIVKAYRGFVFAVASVHPEYAKDISNETLEEYFEKLVRNKHNLVGIGETGLDYYWIKEAEWREKQKEWFRKHIELAKNLGLPIVIHSRDAANDTIEILEEENAKRVHWHMFGEPKLLQRVIDNGWYVSMNAIVLRSKKHKKVVRDVPLERIMLETDSPWLAIEKGMRNEPTTIVEVAKKIAEVKKVDFEVVWKQAAMNAIRFYGLPIKLEKK